MDSYTVKVNPYEILGEMILRVLDFDEQVEEWVENSGWFVDGKQE